MNSIIQKINFIEQLRGIAILLVLIYHYTSRIPHTIMGSETAPSVEFFYGEIGVYLFFVISGYLIAKTIEKCSTLGEFYAKRISRIWPLFIVANIFVFMWTHNFETPVVPSGVDDFDVHGRSIYDLIGSTFLLTDIGLQWVDGAYWSILVEVKYYAIIGVFAVFFRGKFVDAFSWAVAIFGLVEFSMFVFYGEWNYTSVNKLLHSVIIAHYLPFFAVGMMIYQKKYNLLLAICLSLCITQIFVDALFHPFVIAGTVKFLTIFVAFLIFDQMFTKGKICLFMGKYSYSIYLFHQVIGLSIIMMLTPKIGIDLAIFTAFVFVLGLAVFSSVLVEWKYRRRVTALLINAGTLIGMDRLRLDLEPGDKTEKLDVAATPQNQKVR
jgi:peptidoglycan/LPS O-acetylase OafA/YrhL